MQRIQRLVSRIESSELLDRLGERLDPLVRPLQSVPAVNDALTGRWLGHSVHPMLVALPIGCWSSAALLDVAGSADAARRLTGAGVALAAPTALTGSADWLDTSGAERRVGVAHAVLNDVAVGAFGLSWLARRRGRRATGMVLGGAGLAAMGAAGYLGGHLAYVRGVGVNTTAFQSGPDQWTRLVRADELTVDRAAEHHLDGLALLVVRTGDDEVRVLEDRCTHRGGSLSGGELVDGCVECPWHASRFALDDGAVRHGPASVPQPSYEVRLIDGWVEVRRPEQGGLRRNPVGAHADAAMASAEPVAFEDLTRRQLYDRARELDVEGRSRMTKAELVQALRDR